MTLHSDESRVLLAIKALQKDPKLSLRAAAKIYEVNRMTLTRRRAGQSTRQDTRPNLTNLTESEEQAIIQYILELVTRSFPPRLRGVEEIANYLLRVRDAPPVGKNWASKFVKRQLELRIRWVRKYDY
jgi:hypothetical protein